MCDSVDLLGQRCLFQVLQQTTVRLLTLKNTLQAKGENIALSRGHKKKTAASQKRKKTPKINQILHRQPFKPYNYHTAPAFFVFSTFLMTLIGSLLASHLKLQ